MRYLIAVFLALCLFGTDCAAVDVDTAMAEQIGVDELENAVPDDAKGLLSGFDLLSGEGVKEVLAQLQTYLLDTAAAQLESVWKPAVQCLLIVVICSMMQSMLPGEKFGFPIILAGSGAIVFLMLSDTRSFFQDCVETVERLYDFSTVLLPCLAGASVFTGASLSVGVKYTAAALFMNILLNFSNHCLVPLISVYLVCVIGSTVFEQRILGAVSGLIKWVCTTVLTGSVVVFTTYLSVAGLVSSSGEALTAKVTKSALSTGLPIVGGIISDAASTLVAGAAMLRNGIGIFGVLAVVAIMLVPFVGMGIRYLLFKGVGELAELFPNHKFSGLLRGIAGAFGMMLAVVGTGFVMLFLTIISFMNLMGGG